MVEETKHEPPPRRRTGRAWPNREDTREFQAIQPPDAASHRTSPQAQARRSCRSVSPREAEDDDPRGARDGPGPGDFGRGGIELRSHVSSRLEAAGFARGRPAGSRRSLRRRLEGARHRGARGRQGERRRRAAARDTLALPRATSRSSPGTRSRDKIVALDGIDHDEIERRLSQAAPEKEIRSDDDRHRRVQAAFWRPSASALRDAIAFLDTENPGSVEEELGEISGRGWRQPSGRHGDRHVRPRARRGLEEGAQHTLARDRGSPAAHRRRHLRRL